MENSNIASINFVIAFDVFLCIFSIANLLASFKMACNPPKYDDLGKDAKDLLNKNYCKFQLYICFFTFVHPWQAHKRLLCCASS